MNERQIKAKHKSNFSPQWKSWGWRRGKTQKEIKSWIKDASLWEPTLSFLPRTVIHLKHRVSGFRLSLSAGGKTMGGQNVGPVGSRVHSTCGLLKPWSCFPNTFLRVSSYVMVSILQLPLKPQSVFSHLAFLGFHILNTYFDRCPDF